MCTEEALNELYLNFPLELYTDVSSLMEKYIIKLLAATYVLNHLISSEHTKDTKDLSLAVTTSPV